MQTPTVASHEEQEEYPLQRHHHAEIGSRRGLAHGAGINERVAGNADAGEQGKTDGGALRFMLAGCCDEDEAGDQSERGRDGLGRGPLCQH